LLSSKSGNFEGQRTCLSEWVKPGDTTARFRGDFSLLRSQETSKSKRGINLLSKNIPRQREYNLNGTVKNFVFFSDFVEKNSFEIHRQKF